MSTRARREADMAAVRDRARESATPPPPAPPPPLPDAPPAAEVITARITTDVPTATAARLKIMATEAAQVRGWRRANVGDLLAALVDELVRDPALQRKVIAAMVPPVKRKTPGASSG